ncbi:hypothetical protein R3X27_19965 [Tropicimonas sp. TH_r6]|uniref:hypothetical protein n=1 Tax=Tropicimonas sp. TH_r6 TaxID=3082085 RepID=UPI00295533B7|nr:hypothetical protein [Tropicimonas sp. TH_r6]MDV7144964.1 hypothetical protein [Tropicimonas sp. TH_r6]
MRLLLILILWLAPLSLAAQEEPAPSAEPLVEVSLEPEEAVVGQPVVLRISVLVPTWMPQPPQFPSMDVPNVITRLPEGASGPISERVEGETWSGVGRAYRLYPMVPGPVSLPAQTITLTYADPETTQPVSYEATLDPISFNAVVPPGAEGLDPLLLAESFTLEQVIEGADAPLGQGESARRVVTAKIGGSSALFIPPLVPPIESEAVRAYPKDAEVSESADRGKLSGSRIEEVTYLAQYGGEVNLPAISFDWFNTGSGKVETASLEAATLTVDAPPPPVAARFSKQQVALIVGGLLVLGLLGWGLTRYALPPLRRTIEARRAAWLASEGYAARQVEAAIAAQDLSALVTTLSLWDTRCPGRGDALDPALAGLGAVRYGRAATPARDSSGWQEMRRAFRAERARRRAKGTGAGKLPPLNPA